MKAQKDWLLALESQATNTRVTLVRSVLLKESFAVTGKAMLLLETDLLFKDSYKFETYLMPF